MQQALADDTFELPNFSAIMAEIDERPDAAVVIREHLDDLADAAADDLYQLAILLYGPDYMGAGAEMAQSLGHYLGERAGLSRRDRKRLALQIESDAYHRGITIAYRDWGTC